ncbi:class I glutamine amidotransferase-like protein [Aspergillus campestris IBT 28561]|uniref:Class I glutamine amidotransferase-like protein n=1 Tax=Aspergillus campestris (strain IBT 28561) TaxID=1392248 RepID=A0A2I1D1R0_ASPC2|nr:class I glutamine amidotransferase-like protein [Aspergillus campestris IBT 28561]PKY03809.1 class I glutamine amidotransferase-like protein [Aspergillus campestris IBT 28561]
MSPPKKYYKVAVLIFKGVDLLDFTGPLEILSHVSHNHNPDDPDLAFTIDIIARDSIVRAKNALSINADLVIADPATTRKLPEYDILVCPGAPPSVIDGLIASSHDHRDTPEVDLIRRFAALPRKEEGVPRVVFSICTGAFLVAKAGLLTDGVVVTTHHRALESLGRLCAEVNDPAAAPPTIIHRRYVDQEVSSLGVRLLTAGGISSGLDASLHLVSRLISPDMAQFVARVMEYDVELSE